MKRGWYPVLAKSARRERGMERLFVQLFGSDGVSPHIHRNYILAWRINAVLMRIR